MELLLLIFLTNENVGENIKNWQGKRSIWETVQTRKFALKDPFNFLMYNKRNIKNPWSPDAKNDFLRPFCIFTEYFLPFENNKFDIYSDCLSFLTLFLSSLNASYIPLPKVGKVAWLFICHLSKTDERHTDGQMVGQTERQNCNILHSHRITCYGKTLLFTFNKWTNL